MKNKLITFWKSNANEKSILYFENSNANTKTKRKRYSRVPRLSDTRYSAKRTKGRWRYVSSKARLWCASYFKTMSATVLGGLWALEWAWHTDKTILSCAGISWILYWDERINFRKCIKSNLIEFNFKCQGQFQGTSYQIEELWARELGFQITIP